jgi:hypothetical protein
MKFCKYCGKQLADNETCSCPDAVREAQQQPQPTQQPQQYVAQPQQSAPNYTAQQPQQYNQQQYNQQQYNQQQYNQQQYNSAPVAPAKPSPIMVWINKAVATAKSFFSMNYENTVKEASNDKSHQWLVITVVAVIFSALSSLETAGISFKTASSYVYRNISLFPFTIVGFFTTAAVIFGVATAIFLIAKVYKTNLTYINALNMTACAYFPVLLGTTVNFVFTTFASVLVSLVAIASHIMFFALICVAVRKVVPQEKSPFWAFTVAMTACAVVIFVFVLLMLLITIGTTVFSLISSFA